VRRDALSALLAVAAGCGARPPATVIHHAAEGPPEVELVVASGATVRFVRTSPTGLHVTRTVTLPSSASMLAWVGAEPVVMLASSMWRGDQPFDPAHAGEVGHLTSHGYEPYPEVPAARWALPHTGEGEHFDHPMYQGLVDDDGAVWQGRCYWGGIEDGGWCSDWVWARVAPGPLVVTHAAPVAASPLPMPRVTPPSSPRVEIVSVPAPPPDDPEASPRPPRDILRCTEAGHTVEYPPDDHRDEFFGVSDLTWVTSSPPRFYFVETVAGYNTIDLHRVFDGCAAAPAATESTDAHLEAGPHDLLALVVGDRLEVSWRGRTLGTLDDVDLVRFAPGR
jgi:hypothetical protein